MRLVVSSLFVALSAAAAPLMAQTAPPADTAAYRMNRFYTYYPGTLQLADGSTVSGYMPVTTQYPGWDQAFGYYLSSPLLKPKPKLQIAKVADVNSISVHGHYYETMRLADEKKPKYLAERFVNGPVELFLQAEPESIPVPIPVAGAFLHTAIPYTNSTFFVRRGGQLVKVSRGDFKVQMYHYLLEYPELAKKVVKGEENYHYRNLVGIITEFNQYLASKPQTATK